MTARVRMAKALARLGHDVQMVVNCPEERWIDGVHYRPLHLVERINTDVLILNTSGGAYDLSEIQSVDTKARLRIQWISGTSPPRGWKQVPFDFVYVKSNYLLKVVVDEWGLDPSQVFVSYNGVPEDTFAPHGSIENRDPFRLAYFSHPSKGLQAAKELIRRVREEDERFHLEVFGGEELWGEARSARESEIGIHYRGLVGQRELAAALQKCSFSICLQSRMEPFGMVVTESMRSGCIVLASPVGAYKELVLHGENGLLIPGDPHSESVQSTSKSWIMHLSKNSALSDYLRENAMNMPWTVETVARAWVEHWRHLLGMEDQDVKDRSLPEACPSCAGEVLGLRDGYHCLNCGLYQRVLSSASPLKSRDSAL